MSLPTVHPPLPILLQPEPLTPASFAPFGTAIFPPVQQQLTSFPSPIPNPLYPAYQAEPILANQSTALKTAPVSPLVNNYPVISETRPASSGLMSIFSSFPRRNIYSTEDLSSGNSHSYSHSAGRSSLRLKVGILERHPYTTQTFCPFNYSAATPKSTSSDPESSSEIDETYVLIIVAPTLPSATSHPRNPPDLTRLRAFLHPLNTTGPNAAVTYNPGTWHAPMIVLGSRRVDFLVTQFVNGVHDDDCQEVLVGGGPDHNVLSSEERQLRRTRKTGEAVEVDLSFLMGRETEGEISGVGKDQRRRRRRGRKARGSKL